MTSRKFYLFSDKISFQLPPVPRYNPMSRCLSSNVILNQKGGLPSERDARRKKESERLTNIRQENGEYEETTST